MLGDALAELLAHGFAPLRCNKRFDVVAWQRCARGQAMDVVAHIRPVDEPLAAHVLPRAQPRHAPSLGHGGVGRQHGLVCALLFPSVVEHKHQAFLAIDLHLAGKHSAGDDHTGAVGHHREILHLALALDRLDQPRPLLCAGPYFQFGGGAANDVVVLQVQQAAERRVHFQVFAIRQPGQACRVRQHLIDGVCVVIGCAQRTGKVLCSS